MSNLCHAHMFERNCPFTKGFFAHLILIHQFLDSEPCSLGTKAMLFTSQVMQGDQSKPWKHGHSEQWRLDELQLRYRITKHHATAWKAEIITFSKPCSSPTIPNMVSSSIMINHLSSFNVCFATPDSWWDEAGFTSPFSKGGCETTKTFVLMLEVLISPPDFAYHLLWSHQGTWLPGETRRFMEIWDILFRKSNEISFTYGVEGYGNMSWNWEVKKVKDLFDLNWLIHCSLFNTRVKNWKGRCVEWLAEYFEY